jgi:hypothetical protein
MIVCRLKLLTAELLNSRARWKQVIVGVNLIKEIIAKLEKIFSCGSDGICAHHFDFANDHPFDYIALLFHMIFRAIVVPDCLCVGVVTPVLKKGNHSFDVRLIDPLQFLVCFGRFLSY